MLNVHFGVISSEFLRLRVSLLKNPPVQLAYAKLKRQLGTGHKVQRGGGWAGRNRGGSSIFKLMKRGGSPKYWSCL